MDEVLAEGWLFHDKRVDQAEELHNPLVHQQVFMFFEKILIVVAVLALNEHVFGLLLRYVNGKLTHKVFDMVDRVSRLISAWNSHVEVGSLAEFFRNGGQLDRLDSLQIFCD